MNENTTETTQMDDLSDQEIIYRLAAFGANTCNSSYDPKMKVMSDRFCNLSLVVLLNMWDLIDDKVKIRIINLNSKLLKTWINSFSENK